jgi:hypothetical protein
MIFKSHCNIINFPNTVNTSAFYSTQHPNKNRTRKGPENAELEKAKSIDSDIVNEKARDIVENAKKSTTIKDDSPTNIDEETVR